MKANKKETVSLVHLNSQLPATKSLMQIYQSQLIIPGLETVRFTRLFSDKRFFSIATDPKLNEYLIDNKRNIVAHCSHQNSDQTQFCFLCNLSTCVSPERLRQFRAVSNAESTFIHYEKGENFLDGFHFYWKEGHSTTANTVINKRDYILNTIPYIKNHLSPYFKTLEENSTVANDEMAPIRPDHFNYTTLSTTPQRNQHLSPFGQNLLSNLELILKLNNNVGLTPREIECLRYVLVGCSAKETANELKMSRRTVETHIEHIKKKLNCYSKSDILEFFFKNTGI